MESEFEPQPQSSGSLDPPRRKPPAAVDTMELPPPPPRRGRRPARSGFARRALPAILASLLLTAGIALLWPLGWRAVAGVALVGVGRRFLGRFIASRVHSRAVHGPRQGGRMMAELHRGPA